jgi:hypothetical protein
MTNVIIGPNRPHVVTSAAARANQEHHQSHFQRSRIIKPSNVAAVAQTLAATEPEDLGRLKAVLEEAQEADASAEEVAARVEEEVPTASFLAPLLKNAGTPLATWLTFLLALIGMFLAYRQQHQAEPVITPEQVEEIITRVVNELELEPADEPQPKAPKKRPRPSGR